MTPGHRGVAGLSLCPRIWGGPALFLVPILLTLQEFVHTRSPQWGRQLFSGIAPAHPGAGVGRRPGAPCEPRVSLEPSWSQVSFGDKGGEPSRVCPRRLLSCCNSKSIPG